MSRARTATVAVVIVAGALAPSAPAAPAGTRSGSPGQALRVIGKPGHAIALAAPSRRHGGYIAKVLAAAPVYRRPGAGPRVWTAGTRTMYSRSPTQLMVLAAKRDAHGRAWLKVALPIRPNGASGWVSARRVALRHADWFVVVNRSGRSLRVYRRGRLVRRARVVVGARATPTPTGLFAVYERTRQADPHGFIGPWALHLTAFSDVLENFGGGPGRVAIHGRDGASLLDPLGSARSHGCVRVDDAVIRWLRVRLGAGTPVLIGG